jgi:hypothetical protein
MQFNQHITFFILFADLSLGKWLSLSWWLLERRKTGFWRFPTDAWFYGWLQLAALIRNTMYIIECPKLHLSICDLSRSPFSLECWKLEYSWLNVFFIFSPTFSLVLDFSLSISFSGDKKWWKISLCILTLYHGNTLNPFNYTRY